jgi:serine/threonine protein kinase
MNKDAVTPNNRMNCSIGKKMYYRVTTNGNVGFRRLAVNNKSNRLNLIAAKNTKIRKGVAPLDAGKQGTVFLGSIRRRVPYGSEFVIKVCPTDLKLRGQKQIAEIEDAIQRSLYKVVPQHIPKPLAPLLMCVNFVDPVAIYPKYTSNLNLKTKDYSRQTVMFSEYISNGPLSRYLEDLLKSGRKRLNDRILKTIIYQVLYALYRIRKKYPYFRHNDLHLDNVLVKPGNPYPIIVINDFGFARLTRKIQSPYVKKGQFAKDWGIGPKTTGDYDVHLFLNELRKFIPHLKRISTDGLVKTSAFLNKVIPLGYRDADDKYTRRLRLKYGIRYPGFPQLKTILKDGYFRTIPRISPSPNKPRNFTARDLMNMGVKKSPRNRIR